MTYRSNAVHFMPRGRWRIEGELTVRGVVRPTQLEVTVGGIVVDLRGNARVAFHAVASLTRKDFGLLADLDTKTGGVEVTSDVAIDIDVEATRPLTT